MLWNQLRDPIKNSEDRKDLELDFKDEHDSELQRSTIKVIFQVFSISKDGFQIESKNSVQRQISLFHTRKAFQQYFICTPEHHNTTAWDFQKLAFK